MKNKLFVAFCLMLINSVGAQPPAQLTDKELAQKMDAYLTGLVEKNNFSGSILVMKNDHEILKKGYGFATRETKTTFTPQTISTVGSVTKQFTATAILKLEMMGKLSVNDELSKFFAEAPADKKSITLHQLLTHTAGFAPELGDDYEPLTRDAFMKRAFETPLKAKPGERYDYSNVGYSILAAIVELKSGMSYEQFMNKYLFTPAGMKHTGYVLPNWKDQTVATGYRGKTLWGKLNEKPWAADGPYWNLKGNGGILSNVEEMYLWHKALMGDKILNAAAKQKLYGRHVKEGPDAETFYGYGWAIFPTPRNTTLVTHNGGNGIFFCDVLRYIDENVVIIYQTNAMQRGLGEVAFQLARINFIAGFNAEAEAPGKVQQFKTLAEAPNGKMNEELISVMMKGEDEPLKKFINENFYPDFITRVPMEERLPRLKRIGARMKNATMDKVTFDGEKNEVFFKSSEGNFSFAIIMKDGKVDGLGVLEE